jgi:hypothetical protein
MPRFFAANSRRRGYDPTNTPRRADCPQEHTMKQFMIRYQRRNSTADAWHQDIARFIAALDADAELKGRISYRCMKVGDNQYCHIATVADDQAPKILQQRDWFKKYNERTREVGGGEVDVSPIEIVGETKTRL